MRVYGVCNHSPDYMVTWLRKVMRVESSNIHIVKEGNKLPQRMSDKRVFLFLSKKTFRLNLDRINSKQYVASTGFLFSDPISLDSYSDVIPLDFAESSDIHIDAFVFRKLDKTISLDPLVAEIRLNKTDYLKRVLDRVCSFNSLLNPLMSFIYTLPSASHQKPVKEIICCWMYEGQSQESLEMMLDAKHSTLPLSAKHRERIRDILYTDLGDTYKKALNVVKRYDTDDKVPYREIVATFNVSAYDLRYILAIVRSAGALRDKSTL